MLLERRFRRLLIRRKHKAMSEVLVPVKVLIGSFVLRIVGHVALCVHIGQLDELKGVTASTGSGVDQGVAGARLASDGRIVSLYCRCEVGDVLIAISAPDPCLVFHQWSAHVAAKFPVL